MEESNGQEPLDLVARRKRDNHKHSSQSKLDFEEKMKHKIDPFV